MSNKPLFQHRHYCKIAEIIARLPQEMREQVSEQFAINLYGTNPQFSADRFLSAAQGNPTGRDRVRS